MTNQVVPQNQKQAIATICQGIEVMHPSFVSDLKDSGIDPKRFISVAKIMIQTHPQAERLEKANRLSIYNAVRKAAQDGLMIDGKEAALVVYKETAQYQPMIKGIIKLMKQSGEVKDVGAEVVYQNDKFTYRPAIDDMPIHEADWFSEDRGEPIGVWAFVKLTNGENRIAMLTRERVGRIASRSHKAQNYKAGEGLDWEEFWKKAAIRNVAKFAPMTPKLEATFASADEEFDYTSDNITVDNKPTKVMPKETRAAAAVKAKAQENKPEEEASQEPAEANGDIVDAQYSEVSEDDEEYGAPPV